jgi:DNA-directed RNA polymerase specialized sigma24 family protein
MNAVNSLKAAIERLASSSADEDAWRFLYREMRPFVLAILYRRLKDRATAEDAAQEVFLRVLRARPFEKVHDESAFRAYVCGPSRRCARNASAALENFVCYPQKTFSTASAKIGSPPNVIS